MSEENILPYWKTQVERVQRMYLTVHRPINIQHFINSGIKVLIIAVNEGKNICTKNMIDFFYKIIIFQLNKKKDDKHSGYV